MNIKNIKSFLFGVYSPAKVVIKFRGREPRYIFLIESTFYCGLVNIVNVIKHGDVIRE